MAYRDGLKMRERAVRAMRSLASNVAKDVAMLGVAGPIRRRLSSGPYDDIDINGFGKLRLRANTSDIAVAREIFGDRQYDLSRWPQWPRIRAAYDHILSQQRTPLVIDAGANIGASPRWFAGQFPEASIIAVEPDPENAELCRLNTADHPSIRVHELAVGGSSGSAGLRSPDGSGWAVQTIRGGEGKTVPVVTINELLEAQESADLFLVKVDIEGFEEDLFSDNLDWLESVSVLIVEIHDRLFPGRYTSWTLQQAVAPHRFELLVRPPNLIYVR